MRVLVVATGRKTRGGITNVVKVHETGEQWNRFHCRWIETHRDGYFLRKVWYFLTALIEYMCLLPFYQLVHIHVATTQSAKRKLVFYRIAKLFGKKIICHFHPANERFLYEPGVAELYREMFSGADLILVLAPQWKIWINESLGDGPWIEKLEVLYNPCPQVTRNPEIKKKKQILYAATIVKRKGYDIQLKAFAKIASRYPEWNMVFAGNPWLKEGIDELADGKRIAEELGISDRVTWLPWQSGEDKDRLFFESAIFCLASDGEGFPMAVLDSWAYGVPCIVTPVGGIPGVVTDGEEALLFPIGDVDSMSVQMERLMSDENLRNHLVAQADKLCERLFTPERVNERLGNIYSRFVRR